MNNALFERRTHRLGVGLFFFISLAAAQEPSLRLSVRNPSNIDRPQEPVVVAWPEVVRGLSKLTSPSVVVTGENGRALLTQVDDLDADGTPDELVFVADFKAGEERSFMVRQGPKPTHIASPPVRSDAGNWKKSPGGPVSVDDDDGPGLLRSQSTYVFDGIGWESELTGYRLYLDERNAIDIQGKRIPGLYWNFIGSSGVDYQADAEWGMDVLHVGPALGVGGFGFWHGDSVVKPIVLERRRTRIIARGPVRAVVRVDYHGWKVGEERINATSIYTIYGGEPFTEHRLTVEGLKPRTVATGIVKHAASKVSWDGANGVLTSAGDQSRSGEWLRMSVHVRPADVEKTTADTWNDLLLLRLPEDVPLKYVISNRWGNEWKRRGDEPLTDAIVARMAIPLGIRIAH
jgi:hypothetical protein